MSDSQIRIHAFTMLGIYTFLDRFIEDAAYPGHQAVTNQIISTLNASLCAGKSRTD